MESRFSELTYIPRGRNYSKEDIKKKLDGYMEYKQDDLHRLTFGTHLRYFARQADGSWKFRPGGFFKTASLPKYVILTNNKVSWSVDVKHAKFYKKMTIHEMKDKVKNDIRNEIRSEIEEEYAKETERYIEDVRELDEQNKEYEKYVKFMNNKQKKYKNYINKINEEYLKLKKENKALKKRLK